MIGLPTETSDLSAETRSMEKFAEWVAKAAHITPPEHQTPQLVLVSASVVPIASGSLAKTMRFCASSNVYSPNYMHNTTISWQYEFQKEHGDNELDSVYVAGQLDSLAQEVRKSDSLLEVSCAGHYLRAGLQHK